MNLQDETLNLSMSLKIGQGSYGSVYLGKLRGDDVAIKQMNDTKSKEFMSELNILCRVHHTNLIKLIGYATGGDSLFLVYELAQNGALSDHLHNPAVRASRIVGTFGYLAPKYFRDGRITTKSDVYSFGVVLMELLTGQPALSRDASPGNIQYIEHRSLVEYMLSVLENNDPFSELSQCIDPTLTHYHKDSLLQYGDAPEYCIVSMCQLIIRYMVLSFCL
ncbi:hypothetical protein LOK49_LG07G01583 [Camellia lanceoleosa]|uniref:Uncharacterized protein n=1 Tax=Camellia lanceoleosa TaxID=1840588 RepID=A0ACC0GZY6_9ERIC|nr:hypothetical protein LOK49_LG07G01583 [Camellia lanceoleosa]